MMVRYILNIFHITEEFFKYRQSVDRVKTLSALNSNYKMIRIDYSQLLNIKFHLDNALGKLELLYLSTPKLYQGWLAGATVSQEEFQSVYEGKSHPDYCEDIVINHDSLIVDLSINNITRGLSLVIINK